MKKWSVPHTQPRGPFMEISRGFPAELCQMHESPVRAGNVNQAIHRLQLREVLSTTVQQSWNLGPRPRLEQCHSLWDFSFSLFLSFFLKKTNFIVFPFIIEIIDVHCKMFLQCKNAKNKKRKFLIPSLKTN